MANTMKNKFAGFFRGLLRHADESEAPRPVAVTAPHTPGTPAPANVPAAPMAAMSDASQSAAQSAAQPAPANANEIAVPLAAIIAHLPMDLKAKLMAPPAVGQTIALPVDKVTSQLAFGSVKISFGELRRLAPGIFANSGGEFDNKQVSLPLAEILSRLNPALLSRKPVQKVDVAEDISGPFDGRGRGITFTTQPLKSVAAKPAAPSPATAELNRMNQPVPFNPPPITAKPAIPPRTVTPAPAQSGDTEVFSFKARQTAPPSAPIPFNPNPPSAPISFNPNPPAPSSNGNGNGHAQGHTNGNGNGNGNAPLPPFKFATAPAPSAPVSSSAPRPEPAQPKLAAQPKLIVSLDDLAETWPAPLRQHITASDFANALVPFPMNLVEAGLKRGRVTATWKEIRTLVRPSSPVSPLDELQLDLPLKVLAPAFMSAQKQTVKMQSKLAVAEEIPNLFFGFPQPSAESAAPAAPAAPAAAPASAPAPAFFAPTPAPAPVPVAHARPADTNFFTNNDLEEMPIRRAPAPATDFINRQTHPKEIVARAATLPGVAGAVVALADGLRVASQIPADMNADAVAAFLPQIFERVNQTTRELRMGALNNVGFTVGNVPWKIFRVNSIYFAAFGRAGEGFPKSQLAGLAAELDRKKQF
jgi:predicted regulator of Ras-like GTPase activity (Roadblock/LC7/MglB family)